MKNQSILALDYGSKKIGLALKPAQSLETKILGNFKNQGDVLLKIVNLCTQHQVSLIILGYPVSLNGEKNKMALIVENFAQKLRGSLSRKIQLKLFNEFGTTQFSKQQYFAKNLANHRGWELKKDTLAAQLFLKRYIEKELLYE